MTGQANSGYYVKLHCGSIGIFSGVVSVRDDTQNLALKLRGLIRDSILGLASSADPKSESAKAKSAFSFQIFCDWSALNFFNLYSVFF